MKADKVKSLILQISLLASLLVVFFFVRENKFVYLILMGIFIAYALLVKFLIPRKNALSIFKKQMLLVLTIFAVINLLALYAMGLYFGFYLNYVDFPYESILLKIIPIIVIICLSEYVRYGFLSNKTKFSSTLTFASMVFVDVLIFWNLFTKQSVETLMALIGFVFMSAVAYNLLFNFISKNYGAKAIVSYRLITTIYMFIFPIIPNIYMFFRIFLRLLYPFIMYVVIKSYFATRDVVVPYKKNRLGTIVSSVALVFMLVVIGLVSCKFNYCLLVIGSESMTGSIDKGDAIIYEVFDHQIIEEGDVLVFEKNKTTYVHRVIKVENVDGQIRYTTKGDANESEDSWIVLKSDIIGINRTHIKFIGYPTLWINSMFDK